MFQTKEDCFNHFKENYNKPGHELFASGVSNVHRYYQGLLSKADVKSLLASVESYSLHREFKRASRNPSYTHFKRYQVQIDLIDIQGLSRWNDGFKYLLAAIDTFTRKAFIEPCKDKTGKTVLTAFKTIYQKLDGKIVTLVADRGSELRNSEFISFCRKEKIKFFHNYTSVHAAYIERFNRTIQNMIYRYLSEFETKRYVDVLPAILSSYNNRYHRIIGMSPNTAEMDHSQTEVALAMSKYHSKLASQSPKPKYKVGQLVRIALQKSVFHRGYKEQSNYEVFLIHSVKTTLKKPLYYLETYDKKEKLIGGFYENELTPVNSDIFRVEKVLKTRRRGGTVEHFVKWKGYNSSHNSWISASDITQTFKTKNE